MPSSSSQDFTYQTRLPLDELPSTVLDIYAAHFSKIEHTLFAAIASGKEANALKEEYLLRFGITGRQFNACRIQLQGKIASIKALIPQQIAEKEAIIASVEKTIQKLSTGKRKKKNAEKLHQKKRRLFDLKQRLENLRADQAEGVVRLCFGSKKLFSAQFSLEENGYSDHEEWLQEWRQQRNRAFFLVGSKDESQGNQTCQAFEAEDGTLTLHLRLPNALDKFGKYLEIKGIKFAYGHSEILAALKECQARKDIAKAKSPLHKERGQAINYRFLRDKKGWRLFVTTTVAAPSCVTREELGVIGVDINSDHLAVTETDRFGNPIKKESIPLLTYGKTSHQTKAAIGDACAYLVSWAEKTHKPLAIEELNFQKKKTSLRECGNPKQARMLSSFAYSSIRAHIDSRAYRCGVAVKVVNPAFTSIIGRVKFAARFGLSIHQSAALCIGRRSLGASERLPRHWDKIPDGKGGHVAVSPPVRKRDAHVWTSWRIVGQELQGVLAAHFWATKSRSLGPSVHEIAMAPELCQRNSGTRIVNTTALLTCLHLFLHTLCVD